MAVMQISVSAVRKESMMRVESEDADRKWGGPGQPLRGSDRRPGGGGMSQAKVQARADERRHEPGLLDDRKKVGRGLEPRVEKRYGAEVVYRPLVKWTPLSTIHQSKASGHFVQRRGMIECLCL